MRKFVSLFIAFILFCSCALPVLAAEGDKYKLSFNTNGIQEIEDQWYKENENIKLPAGEADGYMFIGWYANKDFTELFTLDKMPSEDTIVYGLYAVPLSKLVYKFDNNTIIKDAGLTPEEFNELAKKNGFEIVYTINGNHYTVEDTANYMSEITETVNKDIGKGKTAGMNVTIKGGKEDVGTVYTFNIYNDMVADKTVPITTITKTEDTQIEPKPDADTGSEKTIPALIIFFILTIITTTVVKKVKKDGFKNSVSKFNAVNKKSRVIIKKCYQNINKKIKK